MNKWKRRFFAMSVLFTATIAAGAATYRYAVKPATSDAIQYVSVNGNDTNDGLSQGSAKLTPAAAITALPSVGSNQGGAVYMAAGTYVLTSTLTIGSATENVVIRPLGRIIIQCNITNGSKCIDIFPGSGFKCLMNEQNNCAIDTFGATTNVVSLVATDTTVQGQGLFLDGLVIRDSHAATVSTALLDYSNAFDAEHFGLTIDPGPNETGLFIHDASATICPNADHFYALNIQGSFPEFSGKPLVIKDDLGCSIGPLDFNGFDISHPASGNSNIEINGNGHNFGVFGIHFSGGYEEDSNANISTPAMNLVQDATNITFENVSQLRLNASASEYAYQVSGAAAIGGISIINNFANGGTGHNFVTNTVSGVNDQDNLGSSYYYPGNQAGFGKFYFDGAPLVNGIGAASTVASGTATMTSGAITAASCQTAITTAATGVTTTDSIKWAYATAPSLTTDALLSISPYVTSGNVNFIRCNPTAGSITGTAIVINWRVVR